MTKTILSMVFVVAGGVALTMGCSTPSGGSPGTAGTTSAGSAGTTATGAAGTTASPGTAGTTSNTDAGADAGCPTGSGRDGGVCVCRAAGSMICGSACSDVMTDNDHCGNCTTKCAASASCVAGKCGPTPTPLVPAAAGCTSIHLALAGTTLYWTDQGHGTIKSIGTAAGAAAAMVAGTQMAPTLLKVAGTTVFWVNTGNKTVMKAPAAGGAAAMVATSATDPITGVTASADGATVYFSAGKHILKVPAAGGATTNIFDQADGEPGNLALEGTNLTFGSDTAQDVDVIQLMDGRVSSCGMRDDGGNGFCLNGLRLARSQGSILLDQVYLIGGKVYWAHGPTISSVPIAATATGGAMPLTNITSTVLFDPASALFIEGTTAYFAENGAIEKSTLTADSTAVVIARGQMTPSSIAADANNLYWATADCAIMTMPAK